MKRKQIGNSAIMKAAKLAIKRAYMPKSLRGKVKIVVDDEGIKLVSVIKTTKQTIYEKKTNR